MSLIHEFKAQVQTQSITLRWYFQGGKCVHKITGQYDVDRQPLLWTKPVEQTADPDILVFRQVLQSLLEAIEKRQLAVGRTIRDVQHLIKLSDDINAQLFVRFGD